MGSESELSDSIIELFHISFCDNSQSLYIKIIILFSFHWIHFLKFSILKFKSLLKQLSNTEVIIIGIIFLLYTVTICYTITILFFQTVSTYAICFFFLKWISIYPPFTEAISCCVIVNLHFPLSQVAATSTCGPLSVWSEEVAYIQGDSDKLYKAVGTKSSGLISHPSLNSVQ